jgi:iron complex transport system substrate-binding protein
MDLELLASLKPDLYVDMAMYGDQLWYLGDTESRVAEIVPTVGISMQKVSMLDSIERFEELSALLGADLQAADVVEAKKTFAEAESDLRAAIAEKPGLRVMVCSPGLDQLYVASPEWMCDLHYFEDLGLDIVKHGGDDFFEQLSWEQAGKYQADLILVDERTAAADLDALKAVGTWAALPAVKAGQIGPWYAGAPWSHKRFAPIMSELAGVIRKSRADIV